MTDDALDPRDELASAHLDGETSPTEAEDVAADADVAERIAAFAATRDAVRAADAPVDAARREAAIAAALAAFDEAGADVTPIAARRRPTVQRWQPLVGVAAAALAAAVLVPLLTRDDDKDEPSLAADATTTLAAPFSAGDRAASGPAQDNEIASGIAPEELAAAPPAETADLGAQPDVAALTTAVRGRLASPSTTVPGTPPVTPAPEAETCLAGLRQTAADAQGATLLQVVAVLDGRPVAGTVTQLPDGRQVLDVVALDGCEPVASTEL
jgi:hypothetical protein